MPPVEAPVRITIPIAAPIHNPPNTVQITGSVVMTKPFDKRCIISSAIGYTKVDKMVVAANFRPSTKRPRKNITALKQRTKVEMGTPNRCWIKSAIPVVPPVISPPGRIKKATPQA